MKPTDIKKMMNTMPVRMDGTDVIVEDSTKFSSSISPIRYGDGRLSEIGDYVVYINYNEHRFASVGFAQVWANLYFDNEDPIGLSINSINSYYSSPKTERFAIVSPDGEQKFYFCTKHTFPQHHIDKSILPLHNRGEKLDDKDENFLMDRLIHFSENNGIATFALAMMQKEKGKDIKGVIKLLVKSAQQGYVQAYSVLALIAKNGEGGMPKDLSRYIALLKKGSDHGDPESQYQLALAYIYGKDLEKNHDLAYQLIVDAAKQYHFHAYFVLAKHTRYGDFSPLFPDFNLSEFHPVLSQKHADQALYLFNQAADEQWSGQQLAEFYFADCIEDGIGCEEDFIRALKIYERVVKLGNLDYPEVQESYFRVAKFKLAVSEQLNQNGEIEKAAFLSNEAIHLLNRSIEVGHMPSKLILSLNWIKGGILERDIDKGYEMLKSIDKTKLSHSDQDIFNRLFAQEI